jgi:Protein phosphatase 2C
MPRSAALDFRVFWRPKRGNAVAEYEDAFAGDVERGRFAIADGASESAFASEWARLLVEEFARSPNLQPTLWTAWLPALQQRWLAEVNSKPLPWYAEEKVEHGAFATFLGLVVQPTGWQAVAVGDSCLFQIREGCLHQAFPLYWSEQFNNSPWLVGSRTSSNAALEKKEVRAEGDCQECDRLWLMTDALAQWFLQQVEAGRKPWDTLELLLAASAPDDAFGVWVAEARNNQELRNDDVTLMRVILSLER